MCGIFGAIAYGNAPITVSSLRKMARGNERRGRHACGFAWIDDDGRLHTYKAPGPISEHLDVINDTRGARAVIAHVRYATHGAVDDNANNHPHESDGGWIVHNGQIPNYGELCDAYGIRMSTSCDSEVLAKLIARGPRSLTRRIVRSVNACDRTRPLNMAGLWSRPGRVAIVKRGNPLMWSRGSAGNLYFATLKHGLPGKPTAVAHNAAYVFDLANGEMSVEAVLPWIDTGARIAGSGSTMSTTNDTRTDVSALRARLDRGDTQLSNRRDAVVASLADVQDDDEAISRMVRWAEYEAELDDNEPTAEDIRRMIERGEL
jgi:hypothetical protein